MDLKGARFRPLENSPRYGPKEWKQDSDGVWVEQEMTEEERAWARLESTLAWASPSFLWFRSTPITEEDARREPGLKSYVDGCAVFPDVENINESTPEGAARARAQERLWQERAEKMHDQQTMILPPEKPTDDNALTRKFEIETRRGD